MHNGACACDGWGLCARMCMLVFVREQKTTNNTLSTKIQCCAFVSVTPIHLAWQRPLYLSSCSRVFSSALLCTPVEVYVCAASPGEAVLLQVVVLCSSRNVCARARACVNAYLCVLKAEPKSLQIFWLPLKNQKATIGNKKRKRKILSWKDKKHCVF